MPTYEYRCPEGHDFERFYRKISDASTQVICPDCGKIAERIMSVGGGLLFKGSGFYLTDYGKNAHRSSAPLDKSDKSDKSDKGGEGSSKEPVAPTAGSGSKDSAPSSGTAAGGGESKPVSDSKAAPAPKASSESKPASSGGSSTSKDK